VLGEDDRVTALRWNLDEARDLLWRVAGMVDLNEHNERVRKDVREFLSTKGWDTNDD